MKTQDFEENIPGHLKPTINGAFAFVPDPIPENLDLRVDTIRLLATAEYEVGRLAGTTAREFNPYLIGSPLLHREAILSSRMEGTVTTPEQLVLFEAETQSPTNRFKADQDTQEVLNYVKAMQRGLDLLEELPVCLRLIRAVHGTLLANTRGKNKQPGEFRKDQNWIRGRLSKEIEDARFVPPPISEMNKALHELEIYLNREQTPDQDPILVQLALIHYQFETIHPFGDGNGRVGRLLIPLLMCSHGRLDTPLLYLSGFFERNREMYQDLLLRVSQKGDWFSWINFFLQGVRDSAKEANHQAIALLELRQKYHRQFQHGRSSALLMKLIDKLFQTPSISIPNAAKLLGVTYQAAANNIHKLEEVGILREYTGQRRNQVFLASEILQFMYDAPKED